MKIEKLRFVSLAVATLMSAMTSTALADPPPAAPPPGEAAPAEAPAPAAAPAATESAAPAAGPESKMRLGLNVVPMPFGKFTVGSGGVSASGDTAFAFGIMPFFDYLLTRNFFVGLGPMYTLNVKSKDATGSASKELDLQARIGGEVPASDQIEVYGYVAPGYSIIMPPSGSGSSTNAKGFEVGFHAGGMFNVSPLVFLNAEVGYQLGFQKVTEGSVSADAKSSFFQIGLGGGVHL